MCYWYLCSAIDRQKSDWVSYFLPQAISAGSLLDFYFQFDCMILMWPSQQMVWPSHLSSLCLYMSLYFPPILSGWIAVQCLFLCLYFFPIQCRWRAVQSPLCPVYVFLFVLVCGFFLSQSSVGGVPSSGLSSLYLYLCVYLYLYFFPI